MLFYIFICNVLYIPIVFGTNITTKIVHNNNTSFHEDPLIVHETKSTKEVIVSEGGSLENSPSLTLPKENHTTFMGYKEISKDKSTSSSSSKVKPRKGVAYVNDSGTESSIKQSNITEYSIDTSTKSSTENKSNNITSIPISKNDSKHNKTILNNPVQNKTINQSEVHKKPLVLSYEVLANKDKDIQNDQLNIPAIKSSSNTLTPDDQMPSPTKENGATTKVHAMSASGPPGMVMPIVITILVVPVFAVLGYMALRHGQEAWKNRHYKRMDFLLDGMYND